MKLSELIAELQRTQARYGDLPLLLRGQRAELEVRVTEENEQIQAELVEA